MDNSSPSSKARLGIPGLDDILLGGLRRNRLFLFEGSPGTGKTTLALQFLLEWARIGEKGLYITISETEAELRETAVSHGWSLGDAIDIFELVPPENLLNEEQQQSLLYSSDGAVRDVVGIRSSVISDMMKLSDYAARSIG